MKYYSIGRSNEIEVIGHYPQTERTSQSGCHVDAFNSERNVKANQFPEFEPNYGIDIHPNAIETDLLDKTVCLEFGMVVSEKLKLILSDFKLPPHKFYPVKTFNSSKQYYWFHYITDFEKYIDFKDTIVERFNLIGLEVIEELKFKSSHDLYLEKRKSIMDIGKPVRYKTITLLKDFPNYDLFEVKGAQNFTLITEQLREILIKEKITGFEFLEFDKIESTPNTVYSKQGNSWLKKLFGR